MRRLFQHHPDGIITLEGPAGRYADSPATFAADLGRAYPGLPAGATLRMYDQGAAHWISDGANAEPQEIPWKDGDDYLAALPALLVNQAARIQAAKDAAAAARTTTEKRRAEYPAIWELLDAMVSAGLVTASSTPELTAVLDKIRAVRQKYPG